MSKIEEFKSFIRTNPSLIKEVQKNNTSWQKLFELWDISGPNASVWNDYGLNDSKSNNHKETNDFNLNDLMRMAKNINLQSVQKGINNLQKTIVFLQELTSKDKSNIKEDVYVPRPMYKHFED